jgi:quercetin dioxygenase-like cupin family protein
MAQRGEVLESQIAGQRVVLREISRETDGELLRLDFFVAAGGSLADEHYHPHQEESVRVVSGNLRCRVGSRERDVGAGETVILPRRTVHTLWNDGTEEAHAVVEYRPALRTEDLFVTLFELGRAGKTNQKGTPNFLHRAIMLKEFEDEYRIPWPPWMIQRPLLTVLAPISKLLVSG